MAKLTVKAGSTSRREYIFIQDSTSTTGAGKTSLAYNTSGLKAYYVRPGATSTAITIVTQTVTGSYSSGGFVEVDSTNMPGVYRFDVPDAAFAASSDKVIVMLSGATGMAPVVLEYDLVAYDPTDTVHLGLTALPNVAAGASGGLPTGNASGQVTVASLVATANEGIADAVWDEAYSTHTAAGSFGKLMDILRKSNLSTEGSVTNTTRTTAKFTTSLTRSPTAYTENYFAGQTLLFVSGDLTGQSSVIESFTVSGGVIVLDSPLSDTPANGAEFVILPIHVHPSVEIGQAMLDKRLGEAGRIPYVSASLTNTSSTIDGFNAYQNDDRVTPQTSGGGFTAGNTYYVLSTVTPTTFQLANNSGGTAISANATTTLTFMPIEERTVRSAMQYLRNKIELASGELKVYSENDTVLAWKAATTTDSNANPITVFDPTN